MIKWLSKNKTEFIVLFLILLTASFFRLYRIYDYATFLGDEGRDVLVVKKMITECRPTLLGPSTSVGNLYLGPFYYYLMLVPLWLAGFDPVGPAIMVALLGVATVFLIYRLGKDFFDPQTGMIAAGLYAVSQSIIAHTRFSWNPNPMPFFAILAIYSLLKLIEKKKGLWFPILGASLAVCFQLHYVSLAFIFSLFLMVFLFKPRVEKRWYWFGLGAFFLVLSPMIAFELRHNFIISQGFWRFFREEEKLAFSPILFLKRVGFAYWRLFDHFLAADKRWLGIISLISASLSFQPFLKKKKKGLKILAFWWFLGILGAAFYIGDLHDHYLGFLFPVPFLLIGLFLSRFFRSRHRFLGIGFLIFLLIVNCLSLDLVAGRSPNCQIRRAKAVGKSIAEDVGKEKFNLSLISPTRDFRAMNYRYFVEVFGAHPQGFENYSDIETLYVILEQEGIGPTEITAWEIASFGEAEIAKEWRFEEFGFRVRKLKKTSSQE